VNDALLVRLQHLQVTRLLDEMDAEFGPVATQVTEEAARHWPGTPETPTRPSAG
jgi:hypothetical protein